MKKNNSRKKVSELWGAAFTKKPSEAVIAFTSGRDVTSISPADLKLIPYDLWTNKAHALMLEKTGIISKFEAKKILKGLLKLEQLAVKDNFLLDPNKEDVHTNIESWLIKELGIEIAGKLHTARSRNDQIVTDMRLYLRDQVLVFINNSVELVQTLIGLAKKYESAPFPGFTHHQHAMVTTFGHILAGFATMINRDIERFKGWYSLHNVSPLGNTVSYGTSFPVDRVLTAKFLAFDGPDTNSMDAITNRWETEADLAYSVIILMNHLSLIAQTLIILSMPEFGMVKLADEFSTGSSIMPQKKNPDPLEIIKGKAGFAQGQLLSLLSMGKNNFIGFNRDSQWTKYVVMDLLSECELAPTILAGALSTMAVNTKTMATQCHKSFIGATTLMEQLVATYNLPMRQVKMVVEKAVKGSAGQDKVIFAALYQALREEGLVLPITESQVVAWQEPEIIIGLTKSFGGPGKKSMKQILVLLAKQVEDHQKWLLQKKKDKQKALKLYTDAMILLERK
ncbi:argininosuccinate lyase [Candidatus Parcubacteria bacterium]|nr:argininosuccinate lyase [Candidatus Parcubacteria bacterium]